MSIELLSFIEDNAWSGSSGDHCFNFYLSSIDEFDETENDDVVSSTGDFKCREQYPFLCDSLKYSFTLQSLLHC